MESFVEVSEVCFRDFRRVAIIFELVLDVVDLGLERGHGDEYPGNKGRQLEDDERSLSVWNDIEVLDGDGTRSRPRVEVVIVRGDVVAKNGFSDGAEKVAHFVLDGSVLSGDL